MNTSEMTNNELLILQRSIENEYEVVKNDIIKSWKYLEELEDRYEVCNKELSKRNNG